MIKPKISLIILLLCTVIVTTYVKFGAENKPEADKPRAFAQENVSKVDVPVLQTQAPVQPGSTFHTELTLIDPTNLNTVEGRQALYNHLKTLSPQQIFVTWHQVLARKNPDEMAQVTSALGDSLRQFPNPALYRELGERLRNKTNSSQERIGITSVLMHAATPEALIELTNGLRSSPAWQQKDGSVDADEVTVQTEILAAVTSASRLLVDGGRNWDLSRTLQNSWQTVPENASQQVMQTLVDAFVYVGRGEEYGVFLESLNKSPATSAKFLNAVAAIEKMDSINAPGALGIGLKQYSSNIPLSRTLVRGLISIGTPDAMIEMVNYLDRNTDTNPAWLEEVQARLEQRKLAPDSQKVLIVWRKGK
jgi:hypothetical protein